MQVPPRYIWIPVGIYNGVDLPDTMIDEDYVVWLKMPNLERECEVIFD